MPHRGVADVVVLIGAGLFLVTYATVLVSAAQPSVRMAYYRSDSRTVDAVSTTLTVVGIFLAIWGGTGLAERIGEWPAYACVLGPMLASRVVVVGQHNRRQRMLFADSAPTRDVQPPVYPRERRRRSVATVAIARLQATVWM